MAGKSSISAGKAYVELLVKDNQFVQGLDRAAARLKTFGLGISAIGAGFAAAAALITAPLAAMTKAFATSGASLVDMSKRTGLSVEALQRLNYAAAQTGASTEALETGIRRMQRAIIDAASGGGEAAEAFQILRLDLDKIVKLNPEDQFREIGDAISRISDPTLRAALAIQILSRSGTALLGAIEQGKAGLDAFGRTAERIGAVMDTETAVAGKHLDDAFTDVKFSAKGAADSIGAALASSFQSAAEKATKLFSIVGKVARQNRELIDITFKIAAGVGLVGTAMVAVGATIAGAGAALSGIATIAKTAAAGLAAVGSIVTLLVNPLTLATAAVVGLGAYLFSISDIGGKAINSFAQKLITLKTEAVSAFKGISDALAAGDIPLASQILWTELQIAWKEGTQGLQDTWSGWRTNFIHVASRAFYGALELWQRVQARLKRAWERTTNEFKTLWDSAVGVVSEWLENNDRDVMKRNVENQFLHGDITRAQADEQKKFIDQQYDHQQNLQRKLETDRKAAIDKELADRLAAIDQEEKAAIASLNARENSVRGAADEKLTADIEGRIKALASLRESLQKLQQQAGNKARAADLESGLQSAGSTAAGRGISSRIAALASQFDRVGADLAVSKFSVVGTFNPNALGQIGSSSPVERTAKAAERNAKLSQDILRQLRGMGGAEFE